MLPVAITQSSSNGVAIRYVLPFFWMTYHGASVPESSMMSCLEEVHQVAVEGYQLDVKTTTVFSRVHQNAAPQQSLLSTID